MKSVELLTQLSKNPHYKMTDEEKTLLSQAAEQPSGENAKKKAYSSKGNAAVKEIGKLEKHPSDPSVEG